MDTRLDDLADNIPLALSGLAIVLFLVVLGLINIHFGDIEIGLIDLPLMGIFLWPRMAAPLFSLFFVFCAGLFQDVVNAQPLGMSAFIFVVVFTFFRCRQVSPFWNVWRQFFVVILCVVIFVLFFSVLMRIPFELESLLIRIGVILFLFPIYFFIWKFSRRLLRSGEDI